MSAAVILLTAHNLPMSSKCFCHFILFLPGRVWWWSRRDGHQREMDELRFGALWESVWQSHESQAHTELRLLPASGRFHKARKPAILGSSEGEAAPEHTQEQAFLAAWGTWAFPRLAQDES